MGVDKVWAAVVCVIVVALAVLVGLGKVHWEALAGFLTGAVMPMLSTRKSDQSGK